MKTACILACFGIALATMSVAQADQSSTEVAPQGETLVEAIAGKSTVQVKLKTHEVQIGKPSDPRPAVIESNCTYSKYPCSIVDQLGITVNGTPLFVPRSAFADLADLNKAEIKVAKSGWVLTLDGGDASEGYIVKIYFDATRVERRALSSGTEPNRPLQVTTYNVVVEGE